MKRLILSLVFLAAGTLRAALPTGLHVSGNQILDGSNNPVVLHGVNMSGSEFACFYGYGFFDNAGTSAANTANGIASWPGVNAVRMGMNEDCWLQINGVNNAFTGTAYQTALQGMVTALNNKGLAVILELHWSAPGTEPADSQQRPMPDRDHSVLFWQQVAGTFKNNSAVIFDLFNEPYPDNNGDTNEAWRCWKDGGVCNGATDKNGASFQVAGMQELVTAIRGEGANNLIMLGGVQYGSSFSQWVSHKPVDPANNLSASLHIYDFVGCLNAPCWDGKITATAAQAPVVVGEVGDHENTPCSLSFSTPFLDWLDARQINYVGWNWNTWGSCLDLITNFNGTPTAAWGAAYKARVGSFSAPMDPLSPGRPKNLRVQ